MYEMSDRVRALKSDLEDFMATHIYPSEAEFYRQAEMLGPWAVFPIIEELKLVARRQGLWNLWHGAGDTGVPLGNLEYASLRSEEHTSELQSLMRISYAVLCLK